MSGIVPSCYLTRARTSPLSDPAEPVVAGFVPGFVRACMENLVNRFWYFLFTVYCCGIVVHGWVWKKSMAPFMVCRGRPKILIQCNNEDRPHVLSASQWTACVTNVKILFYYTESDICKLKSLFISKVQVWIIVDKICDILLPAKDPWWSARMWGSFAAECIEIVFTWRPRSPIPSNQ